MFGNTLSHAQVAVLPGQIERSGAKLYSGGRELSSDEINELFTAVDGAGLSREWTRAQSNYVSSRNLMISFGATAACGIGAAIAGMSWMNNCNNDACTPGAGPFILTYTGILTGVVGLVGLAAGTVVFCVSKGRMNRVVSDFNGLSREMESRLSLGLQPGGVGISLYFRNRYPGHRIVSVMLARKAACFPVPVMFFHGNPIMR